MAICVLTHFQAKKWEETAERPSCEYHWHLPYRKAQLAVDLDEAFWVKDSDNSRAIVIFPCVLRYEWRGRRSGNYTTLQMTAIL